MSNIRKIKYICTELGFSRKKLAKIIGKSVATLHQYAFTETELPIEDIINIYKYLKSGDVRHDEYMAAVMKEITQENN